MAGSELWEREEDGYSPSPFPAGAMPRAGEAGRGEVLEVALSEPKAFWENRPVKPGCILEMPVARTGEDGNEEQAETAVFVMEVHYMEGGAWVKPRWLGSSTGWARDAGIRILSRERQYVHLCLGGAAECQEAHKKGMHVDTFSIFPPGVAGPEYIEKAKVREWKKLYAEAVGVPPGAGKGAGEVRSPAVPDPGAADRISALKRKLREKQTSAAPRQGEGDVAPPRVQFSASALALEDKTPTREEARLDRGEGKAEKKRHDSPPRKPKSVREALAAAAVAQERPKKKKRRSSSSSSSAGRKHSRSRSRSKKRKKARRRRKRRDSRRSSSSDRSSSSSSLVPPLQRKANRDPGSVLKMLLEGVAEALSEAAVREDAGRLELGSRGNLLTSYFQIVAKPQIAGKVRDQRELETLARCVDLLKQGLLAELGDALAGRFMAVESAALTNNWQDAQHLEVVPVRHAGLASPAVMLRAQRHTRQVEKAIGRPQWRRSGGGWNETAGPPRPDGPAKGKGYPRGKGKGRGKKGGAKGGGPWKDHEKEKEAQGAGAGK